MTTSSKNVVAVHLTSVMPASLLFLKSDFLGIRGDFKDVRNPVMTFMSFYQARPTKL